MKEPTPSWADAVHQILREQRVRQVPYVPDTGLARLISLVRSDAAMRAVPLTTEEEGVALAVGAWLGGERSALLLQSSGVGNCINMLGMVNECRVPLLMLVTMRGQWGEFNPWQIPMAQATAPVLSAIGVQRPRNLAVVIMDNEHYGETGMQETHTRLGVDLAVLAKGSGFRTAGVVHSPAQLKVWIPKILRQPGPVLADIKVTTERGTPAVPPARWSRAALSLPARPARGEDRSRVDRGIERSSWANRLLPPSAQ